MKLIPRIQRLNNNWQFVTTYYYCHLLSEGQAKILEPAFTVNGAGGVMSATGVWADFEERWSCKEVTSNDKTSFAGGTDAAYNKFPFSGFEGLKLTSCVIFCLSLSGSHMLYKAAIDHGATYNAP